VKVVIIAVVVLTFSLDIFVVANMEWFRNGEEIYETNKLKRLPDCTGIKRMVQGITITPTTKIAPITDRAIIKPFEIISNEYFNNDS
jgi:hypothetical protein